MKKKISNLIKNNKPIVVTFIISLFIIGFIYDLNEVTPFGNRSLLCVDFFHQYGPMLGGLYNKITKLENIIYSFNIGLGIPFFRNFLNYLSSPFNVLLFLFNKENLLTSFSFIIGLKACLASTNMLYYLNKKFKRKDCALIPLAISYGFSQYFAAYYWNIMWLDGLVFLPLIILGIENIVNNNKWKLYFISLTIMLLSNYFIGYMICIFSCIYFILYLIYKTSLDLKNIKKMLYIIFRKILIFAFASLCAGGIIAFALLPMFSSMFTISATGGTIPETQYYLFEVKDFLISHLTGVSTTVFASDEITSPNISCGILSVILLFLFIINPKIKWKTKIIYALILGFIILAFFNPVLDYIMHAFHVPNDLPYRYSFIYSFILIIICTYSLTNLKTIRFPIVTIIFLLIITCLLYILIEPWAGINSNMLWINIILVIFYYILYIIYKFLNLNLLYSVIGTIIFTSVGIIISINYNWDISQEIKNFYVNYKVTNNNLKYLEEIDDEKFYRSEFINLLTLNDGDWYDYNGVNTFSSMAYEDMAIFQNKLGIPGNEINSYYYQQTTPIYDLLFDVKYLFGESNDYTRYTTLKNNSIQRFDYTNGLIFGVNDKLLTTDTNNSNPFELENEIIKNMTNIEDVLTESKFIKTEELYDGNEGTILKYTYKNNFDNMYFYTRSNFIDFIIIGNTLYYIDENYENLSGTISNLNYSYIDDYNERRIINISSTEKNLEIIIGYNNYYSDEFYLYDINQSLFESAYSYLKQYKFEYKTFKNNYIKGAISVDDNMMIYTSIPYDKGWKVFVDGKKVDTFDFANSLLTFKVDKGKHTVIIKYTPPLLDMGLGISFITALILIFRKKVIKFLKI